MNASEVVYLNVLQDDVCVLFMLQAELVSSGAVLVAFGCGVLRMLLSDENHVLYPLTILRLARVQGYIDFDSLDGFLLLRRSKLVDYNLKHAYISDYQQLQPRPVVLLTNILQQSIHTTSFGSSE